MIICAALKIKGTDSVIGCIRHGNGYASLHAINPNIGMSQVEEGFLTNKGEFLNRTEAFEHAMNCGQTSATTRQYKRDQHETELYSEDLW